MPPVPTSDTSVPLEALAPHAAAREMERLGAREAGSLLAALPDPGVRAVVEIGRASCRERV